MLAATTDVVTGAINVSHDKDIGSTRRVMGADLPQRRSPPPQQRRRSSTRVECRPFEVSIGWALIAT
jgi:hypothetical protein